MRILAFGAILMLSALWLSSLPLAPIMFFAFDGEVPLSEGIGLGIIQATWVAGIPLGLLGLAHLAANGWRAPEWNARWLLCATGITGWCFIVGFWVWASD
jgi:hypothetical protein